MDDFGSHVWVFIPLAALAIPIAGIAYSGLTSWLNYRQKRAALEVIRTYAAQGKEPPPELIAALGLGAQDQGASPNYGDFGGYGSGPGAAAQQAAGAFGDVRAAAREARYAARAERYALRAQYRLARGPVRRWNQAIFLTALAGGLYAASLVSHDPDTMGRFQMGATILGALAVAAILSAVLMTVFRPK